VKRTPDFEQFLIVLRRKGKPNHLPFYEHLASPGFIAQRTGTPFDQLSADDPAYWRIYVDFWIGMGYDVVPMEIAPYFPVAKWHGGATRGSEESVVIRSWADFEKYPWPSPSNPINFKHFETAAGFLPEGARIVGGVCAGPYEWASRMLGTVGMAYLLADAPDLVEAVFGKIGSCHVNAVRQLATMDFIAALRQGDDLGFKTSTFLPPDLLRKLVFPIYTSMAQLAHQAGKPFILHSCGNLAEVYDDLIDGCKIDAKHSFEDVIMPVEDFKRKYGGRVTPLGGLDVDFICQHSREEIRAYARRKIEQCFADGYWALGTGNSLTNYMPVENYMAVLEEGMKVG
jgi:uroporphyrinogen decarboxylase